jgi:hypothetical protein
MSTKVETPWIVAEVMDRFDDEILTEADLHIPDRSNQLSLWSEAPSRPRHCAIESSANDELLVTA